MQNVRSARRRLEEQLDIEKAEGKSDGAISAKAARFSRKRLSEPEPTYSDSSEVPVFE